MFEEGHSWAEEHTCGASWACAEAHWLAAVAVAGTAVPGPLAGCPSTRPVGVTAPRRCMSSFPPASSSCFPCSSQTFSFCSVSLSALFLFCFPPSHRILFSFLLFYFSSSPLPLQEKQRMQQNIDTVTKEVFELQETLLWKDKSIRVWGGTGLWPEAHRQGTGQRKCDLEIPKILSFDYLWAFIQSEI